MGLNFRIFLPKTFLSQKKKKTQIQENPKGRRTKAHYDANHAKDVVSGTEREFSVSAFRQGGYLWNPAALGLYSILTQPSLQLLPP